MGGRRRGGLPPRRDGGAALPRTQVMARTPAHSAVPRADQLVGRHTAAPPTSVREQQRRSGASCKGILLGPPDHVALASVEYRHFRAWLLHSPRATTEQTTIGYPSCIARHQVLGGTQWRVDEGRNRATCGAGMHGTRGDTKRARGTPTPHRHPLRAQLVASMREWHRGRPRRTGAVAPLRHPTARRDTSVAAQRRSNAHALHRPREARPAHLSACRRLALALPPLEARQKFLLGQQTKEISARQTGGRRAMPIQGAHVPTCLCPPPQ